MQREEERNEPCGYRRSDEDAHRSDLCDSPAGRIEQEKENPMHDTNIESFQNILRETEAREPLLTTRETTHGDYADTARIAQTLKEALRSQHGWGNLDDAQRESLEMMATKQARILSGNPNEKDHWDDIAGYAKLVSERL